MDDTIVCIVNMFNLEEIAANVDMVGICDWGCIRADILARIGIFALWLVGRDDLPDLLKKGNAD